MNLDFSDIKVLLIGDFMLDEYIYGDSKRISPEAPVPVVVARENHFSPGGAGNVAMNLSSLGAKITCVGYVGKDKSGIKLIECLKKEKINTEFIQLLDIKTTVKKRFFSNGKQIFRLDKEEILDSWCAYSLAELNLDGYDLVILSDYNKGVLNNRWFRKIEKDNIFVDPKKSDFAKYSNANIITPNLNELQSVSKVKLKNALSIRTECERLIKENANLEYIVAKRGDKGIIIVGRNNYFKKISPHKVKNPDVTGAGDTVIAALSLSFTKFKDIEKAAEIANAAAAVVVGKSATALVSVKEIEDLLIK